MGWAEGVNRDYFAGMTEGRIREREKMGAEQEKLFYLGHNAGILHERDRVLRLLGELNNYGMTHGAHCEEWHEFYEEAVFLISEAERPGKCDGCEGGCDCG